ncbi:hypothetical protein [Paludisphaera rhizosphaerae]|uniref:hypothetical protein n=1 Tax=Paludisphaera rhizosphaerae TaxID=2711216 RepID=UPI0013EC3E3B|nr:hypothetical protein [Paludisphaera rhizosphaerae]
MNRVIRHKGVDGSSITIGLRRRSAYGGYESDADTYTSDDPLTCVLWPGGDLPVAATLPTSWVDPDEGNVQVDFPANAWNGLAPGIYQAAVRLATTPPVDLAYFEVQLEAGPAGGVARPTYITAQEIDEEYPGLESMLGKGNIDLAGWTNYRADAREWLDLVILSHYRPCSSSPYQFTIPWASPQPETNEFLADTLADDGLLQWTPNGRRLRKAQVCWVLAKIFRRAANMSAQAATLLDLSDYYERKANDTLITSIAEIDLVGDGRVSLTVSFRTTVTRSR